MENIHQQTLSSSFYLLIFSVRKGVVCLVFVISKNGENGNYPKNNNITAKESVGKENNNNNNPKTFSLVKSKRAMP